MQSPALAGLWRRHEAVLTSTYRSGGESGPTVTLRFRVGMREVQMVSWPSRYDASIADGPDVEARCRVRLEGANTLGDFVNAPENGAAGRLSGGRWRRSDFAFAGMTGGKPGRTLPRITHRRPPTPEHLVWRATSAAMPSFPNPGKVWRRKSPLLK